MGCGVSSKPMTIDRSPDHLPHDMVITPHLSSPRMGSNNNVFPVENGLHLFMEVEHAIGDCERRFTTDNFHVKNEQLELLEESILRLAETSQRIQQEIDEAERLRVTSFELKSTHDYFVEKIRINDTVTNGPRVITSSKPDDNLLDLLNRKEIAERELNVVMKETDIIRRDLELMKKRGEKLNDLHMKRDEILDSILDGQYGSEGEQKLEKELDWILEQKHHVDQAHFRWKEAQRFVNEANIQLAKAVTKWKELAPQPLSEKKYLAACTTRNLLVTASSSILSALRFLPNIEVPYCNTQEAEVLSKATAFIFTDMQSSDRHEHALLCYNTTRKRVSALGQWLQQVISYTITRDLKEVVDKVSLKSAQLKNERMRLIKERIKQVTGQEVEETTFIQEPELRDSGFDSELDESVGTDELRRLFSEQRTPSTPDPTPGPLIMPTPVPSADLAPIPSNDEIFGKIESIRMRHKQEMQTFAQNQRMSQARMTQGLKHKLQQRKSRRSRLEMHSRQLEALMETP